MLSTTNNSNNHHNNHNNKPRSTVPGVHSSAWNPERHRFQTKASLALTAVTLLLFCVLSVVFHERDDRQHQSSWMQQQKQQPSSSSFMALQQQQQQQQQHPHHQQHRWLNDQEEEENNDNDNNNDNNNNDDDNDYSSYSCNHLYSIVPDRGEAQCQFAKTCNQGVGVWMTAVFCNSFHLTFATWMMILAPLILLWMIVLFRLLGSTAEDYFSPALEMLAVKLGLPPRFAGVTLLALGNGAADVSATVSAITNDPQNGYLLSLGALTGAAMVISSVVSALVVLVAGGVPCRGALVRDVTALGVSVLIVWGQLGSGGNKDGGGGKVGPETVTLFLSLYAVFVLLVLCADVYHRAVVLPRRTLRAQEAERQRQLREQELHQEHVLAATAASNGNNALSAISETPDRDSPTQGQAVPMLSPSPQAQQAQDGGGSPRRNNARFSTVLTAFSNYDNDNPGGEGWGGNGGGGILTGVSGGGVDSEELMTGDRPILLHGSHGILNQKTPTPLLNDNAQQEQQQENQETAYRIMEDAGMMVLTDQTCVETGVANRTWSTAWTAANKEVRQHANQVWDDICYNGDIDVATKFLLICEVPFIVARKITVPIPCEGYYVRGLIALSLALSPLWMAFYIWNGYDVILFGSIVFWCYWGVVLVAALCLLRFAPAGGGGGNDNATTNGTAAAAVEGELSLWVATPVALYGFCVAATWIDIVADALVSLLDFVGIVLRIPGPVVGLTILAWGNSMSDLSANITMARKGLANMAMTACFAGPFFNILVGLGLGFSRLAAQTGQAERAVQLQPSISVGFWFLAVNSVAILVTGLMFGRGRVPKKYGYIALTIYSIYLCVSLLMEYKF